ncbi:glycosyltransferase family 2 protein [Caulobacter sp. 73W]|uniref:Glycosyltransferase family 2 protein n=1 Tax=Caulobacter sp. 73W TaxID=3161137 RepID=A0AB39KYH5_9CAUL
MKHEAEGDPTGARPRIAALLTCHNRAQLTVRSIAALYASAGSDSTIDVFLVDDGSTDGTAALVKDTFSNVHVIQGDGSLFWNGGMRLAWQQALGAGEFDFFLWLNDDLEMSKHTISQLLRAYNSVAKGRSGRALAVGKVTSRSGRISYGGLARVPGFSRLRFRYPEVETERVVTLNGNCVLIPARAVDEVGINSKVFTHAFGDIDYGLRATNAGYVIVSTEEAVGSQERGPAYSRMKGRGIRALYSFANSPKGMPWREWLYFCFRHGGVFAPVNFLAMYINQLRNAS